MRERGFALVAVVILLTLVAVSVYLVNREVTTGGDRVNRSHDGAAARYTAQAGLAHANWVANASNCASYALPVTNFGPHTYVATFTPDNGSPVTINVKGASSAGAGASVSSQAVTIYDPTLLTLSLQPASAAKDTLLDDFYTSRNYGGANYLQINSAGWEQRPALEFDVSAIPQGARIVSALLELKQWSLGTAGYAAVHNVSRAWVEGTQNGGGTADGATWQTFDGVSAWNLAGGDFDATPYASAQVTSATNNQWLAWEIRDLVRAWVGQTPNYGLVIVGDGVLSNAQFASGDTSNPLDAPKLTVDFVCECGVPCGLGGSSLEIVLATMSGATLGGLTFTDKDLAQYDPNPDTATLFLDGVALGIANDLDAVHLLADGNILLSAINTVTLGGLTFENEDVVEYDLANDIATMVFDGSALFTAGSTDISAVHVLANGHLLLSNEYAATLGGLAFEPEDLIEYDLETNTATMFLDGSAVGLTEWIDAAHVLGNGDIVLSTEQPATLGGLNFTEDDLVAYDPIADAASLYFSGGLFDAAENVRAAHVGPGVSSVDDGTGPFAYWKLDDGAGPTAVDSVGSNDGTLTSGPTWVVGTLDGALDFDGVDDYVDAGTFDVTGSGLTMLGWFNAETISTNDPRIVSKANGTSVSDAWWQLSTSTSGSNRYLRMRVKAGGVTTTFADSSVNLIAGQWYFAVSTYDAATGDMKLYLNGTQIASGSHGVGGPVDSNPTVPVAIGANGTAERFFDGVLDDVRVYDRALTATEIADLYPASLNGPGAHWKLDDGVGLTALDSAENNDGTLVGGPIWVTGTLDGALDFDGINDYVDAGTFDVVGSGLTMMGWFNAETISTNDPRIVSKANGTSVSDAWWQLSTSTSGSNRYLRMRVKAGGVTTTFADSSVNLIAGQWYFAAATYDSGTGDMRLYLDGTLVANGSHAVGGAVNANPFVPVAVGANGTPERFFDGVLDDVRVSDRAFSAAEIAALYASGGGGPACAGTIADDFETGDYTGNTGTSPWNGNWVEINESGNPSNGDEQVLSQSGNLVVRVRDNDGGGEGILRSVDLSAFTSATLSFDYWRDALDDANDYVVVEVWPNGVNEWDEVLRIEGPGTDLVASPQSASLDISAYIMNDTHIRFITSPGMGNNDAVLFDNIEVCGN